MFLARVTGTVVATQKLPVLLAACSSEFVNLPCSNLIDGSVDTYWNDKSLQGEGAEFTFTFGTPVQLETIVIMNVTDDEKFMAQVDSAFRAAELESRSVVLLGLEPDKPETSYGWIEPATSLFGSEPGGVSRASSAL